MPRGANGRFIKAEPLSAALAELKEERPAVAAAVEDKPYFAPVPEGFRNKARLEDAGIRVNVSLDGVVSSIQFAENRPPSREEKDGMEISGIRYKAYSGQRQWERMDKERPTANLLDMEQVAKEIAEGRGNGRAR